MKNRIASFLCSLQGAGIRRGKVEVKSNNQIK